MCNTVPDRSTHRKRLHVAHMAYGKRQKDISNLEKIMCQRETYTFLIEESSFFSVAYEPPGEVREYVTAS